MAGPVAIVTGGWRGIGRAAVDSLRQDGFRVAMTYVPNAEPVAEISAWTGADPGLLALPLDLREEGGPARVLALTCATFGGADVLVNNAGVGSATVSGFASDVTSQDAAMLAINAVGTLAMCRAFLAAPGTGGGRKIINIASVGGGIAAFPGFSLADGMSKAAVAQLTRQLAAEHMAPGVDVFAICPGATDTEMFRQSTLNRMTESERAAFLRRLPKERLIAPSEIAAIIAFLAGPQSGVLHGAVIDASMGLGVRPGRISETDY